MPYNLLKKYNDFLDIAALSEYQRTISLRAIFDRDITNNNSFLFRAKVIRPLKIEGNINMDILFKHLTYESFDEKDEKGRTFKSRAVFDLERSKRLHWLWHHIQEKNAEKIQVFSYLDRIKGRGDVIRTYIYDIVENYVIVLEPQNSKLDYYLLTAYYATNEKGGINQIKNKSKKRLPEIY